MRKKILLATKILAIVAICLISFVGIYVQDGNQINNIIKDYKYGKDLKGYREITINPHEESEEEDATTEENKTEESNNTTEKNKTEESNTTTEEKSEDKKESKLTSENFEKSKEIIQKRLEEMGVKDYNIALNKETGLIYLQVPEDENADKIASNINQSGSVEIKDADDTNKVLISSDKFEKASVVYSSTDKGTAVYIQIKFNKEGKEQLKNLSENEYKKLPEKKEETENENTTAEEENTTASTENKTEENTTESKENETAENTTSESEKKEEEKQKNIAFYLSGEQMLTHNFEEPVVDGKMTFNIGQATTDETTFNENQKSAKIICTVLNNGILPIEYKVEENQYVKTEIEIETVKNVLIVIAVVIGLLLIYMIIKNKVAGLLSAIGYMGFVGLYLLLLRGTNVIIELEGIVAGVVCLGINYLFVMNILKHKNKDKKEFNKEYIKSLMKLLPILGVSIYFCFSKVAVLESFGMVMFWGISLIAAYNITITRNLMKK